MELPRWSILVSLVVLTLGCDARPLPRPAHQTNVVCADNRDVSARFTPGTPENPRDAIAIAFNGRRPTAVEADTVLRKCVSSVADHLRVSYEMVAEARYRDEVLALPDGSVGLKYDPNTGEVTALRK
jgi:hypothetical protein